MDKGGGGDWENIAGRGNRTNEACSVCVCVKG